MKNTAHAENLDRRAAELNLYRLDNLPEPWASLENLEWLKEREDAKAGPEGLESLPIEAGVYVETQKETRSVTQKSTYFIEPNFYSLIWVGDEYPVMMLTKWGTHKGWRIRPTNAEQRLAGLWRVGCYDLRALCDKEGIKEPNRIGVFTMSKIMQWAEYCKIYMKALRELVERVEDGNQAQLNGIEEMIQELKPLSIIRRETHCTIKTKYFEITVNMDKERGTAQRTVNFIGNYIDVINITRKMKNEAIEA